MNVTFLLHSFHIASEFSGVSITSFSSVQSLSCVRLFSTPWTAAHQASLSIIGVYSNSCPLSQWCHPTISSSVVPSAPAFNLSQHKGLFQRDSSSHQVAKVLEFQLQHPFFQWIFRTDFLSDGLIWSPCSPRDSQESSPTPQFNISILQHSAFFIVQLSYPYMNTGKTIALTTDLCWQSHVSAF